MWSYRSWANVQVGKSHALENTLCCHIAIILVWQHSRKAGAGPACAIESLYCFIDGILHMAMPKVVSTLATLLLPCKRLEAEY